MNIFEYVQVRESSVEKGNTYQMSYRYDINRSCMSAYQLVEQDVDHLVNCGWFVTRQQVEFGTLVRLSVFLTSPNGLKHRSYQYWYNMTDHPL